MEFRVNKPVRSNEPLIGTIRAEIARTSLKVACRKTQGISGNAASADSLMNMGFLCAVTRWRVVGIGAYIATNGASTKAETIMWGFKVSDLGATDEDAFGSIVCNTTASKQFTAGDMLFKCIDEFVGALTLDALAIADSHTWDISGTGAGLLMGKWQTKACYLTCTKKHIANSTATISPFFFIEYELGEGVI